MKDATDDVVTCISMPPLHPIPFFYLKPYFCSTDTCVLLFAAACACVRGSYRHIAYCDQRVIVAGGASVSWLGAVCSGESCKRHAAPSGEQRRSED